MTQSGRNMFRNINSDKMFGFLISVLIWRFLWSN